MSERGFVLTPTYRTVAGRPQVHLYAVLESGESALIVDDRFRPYLLAACAAYAIGIMALSRAYVQPTYLVVGLAAAYARMAVTVPALPGLRVDGRLLVRIAGVSVAVLVGTYLFVRLTLARG